MEALFFSLSLKSTLCEAEGSWEALSVPCVPSQPSSYHLGTSCAPQPTSPPPPPPHPPHLIPPTPSSLLLGNSLPEFIPFLPLWLRRQVFFFFFNLKKNHSWFTMFFQFLLYSKVSQSCTFICSFFHIILHQVLRVSRRYLV